MTQYVLEILDGDRAGEVVALTHERVTIGRKPTNTLALKDEKASGNHAEVVFEEGRYVLRDLGSTNGTLLDGKRVEEVALSAQDVFVVGRVRVLFRSAEAPSGLGAGGAAGGDDLKVHTVDMARLARSGKRRSVAGLLVLLVALAGGAGFLWWQQNLAPNATKQADRKPVRDSANLLKAGDDSCEVDTGWDLRAGGAGFALSGTARSGQSGLEASWVKPEAGGKAESFALARLKDALVVLPGDALELSGHLRTSGGGRGTLRVRFDSGDAEDATTIVHGAPLASGDAWTEVKLALAVPPTLGKARLELVAVLPGEGAAVAFDDLVLRKGGGAKPVEVSHPKGATLLGTGTALALRVAGKPALLGTRAHVESGELAGLAAKGALCLSDLPGTELSGAASERGFAIQANGGGAGAGLLLEMPPDMVASGVLVRNDSAPFRVQAGTFSGVSATELLLGGDARRLCFRLAPGTKVAGRSQAGMFQLEIAPAGAFEIRTVLDAERQAARDAVTAARGFQTQGKPAEALALLKKLVEEQPYDEARTSEAAQLRNALLGQLGEALANCDAARKKAEFLGSRRALERTRAELATLVATYGEENFAAKEELEKMRSQLESSLSALVQREAEEQRQGLVTLQEVLKRSGMESLAASVEDYVNRRLK